MKVNKLIAVPVIVAAVLGGMGYLWYHTNYPTCTFRYKLTAEVNTPEGVKTGSSVVEVSYSHNADWGGGQSADIAVSGEATFIDLGAGKNLVVTLVSFDSLRKQTKFLDRDYSGESDGPLSASSLPIKTFGLNWSFGRENQLCKDFASLGDKVAEVKTENTPILVTFDNISDPSTAREVFPEHLNDANIDSSSSLRISIRASSDEIEKNIVTKLPWLPQKEQYWKHHGWDKRDSFIDRIGYGAFRATN